MKSKSVNRNPIEWHFIKIMRLEEGKEKLITKKIKTSSLKRLRKIHHKNDSMNEIGNSNLISSTNLFKIIGLELISLKEIERLETIENWPLIQSLRKDKILLKKSYLNEFSYA